MKNLSLIVFLSVLVGSTLLVWACGGQVNLGLEQVTGSGNVKTEKRNVTGFKGIEAGGAIKLEITAGRDFSVELEADDNVLPLIRTEVRGDTLHIERTNKFSWNTNRLIARISLPELNKLEISGASDANVSEVKTDNLNLNASGASKIEISGAVQNLRADLSGASKLEGENLQTLSAKIEASGASKATVFASESIDASASGASRINYAGNPKSVNKNSSGASTVAAQ